MKRLSHILPVLFFYIIVLAISCKSDKSDYRQDDTEAMHTTGQNEPPTAYKDTIVTGNDSLNEPLP